MFTSCSPGKVAGERARVVNSYYPRKGEMKEQQITTECYKCSSPTDSYENAVHPLCDTCQEDFEDWFSTQLSIFTPKEND
jgi:endogenous inhibitor of DNA gyrase (YacG/DUF329 family)